MDKEQEPVATTPHLNAYYSLLIIAAVGHLGLLLFTLASQRLHKHGVLINFYLIFAVTLWFDSILCWTHHMHDPDPPKAIQIVNATFRLSGMVMNSATTLMCVVKFWVSTNIAASTKISKHLHFLDNVTLVIFPYAVGMPFLWVTRLFVTPSLIRPPASRISASSLRIGTWCTALPTTQTVNTSRST